MRGADGSKAGREAFLDVDPCKDQPGPKADDRQDDCRRLQIIPRRLWRFLRCCRMVWLEINWAHDGRGCQGRALASGDFWEAQAKLDKDKEMWRSGPRRRKRVRYRWMQWKSSRTVSTPFMFSLDCITDFNKIRHPTPIEAPLNTNVWKADVKEGDKIKKEKS